MSNYNNPNPSIRLSKGVESSITPRINQQVLAAAFKADELAAKLGETGDAHKYATLAYRKSSYLVSSAVAH